MPWSAKDAKGKTRKADTPKRQRQWAGVANSALSRGDSEASAIKQANAVVKRARKRDRVFPHSRSMPEAHPRPWMGGKRKMPMDRHG